MKVSIRNVTISALCVMMCLTATAFALENSLEKMSKASEDVMALVQELQEKMYAEEGFEVAEMLALLDRFCEERMIADELNQEVESETSAVRQRRSSSDCKWVTSCSYNSRGEWKCELKYRCTF